MGPWGVRTWGGAVGGEDGGVGPWGQSLHLQIVHHYSCHRLPDLQSRFVLPSSLIDCC